MASRGQRHRANARGPCDSVICNHMELGMLRPGAHELHVDQVDEQGPPEGCRVGDGADPTGLRADKRVDGLRRLGVVVFDRGVGRQVLQANTRQ